MDYTPPSGAATANDPYVGKVVAAGQQGSKVPRGAVENPQRELVALIIAAGLAPTNTELTQVTRAVRSGQLDFAVDIGTADALVGAVGLLHTLIKAGLPFTIKKGAAANATTTPNLTITGPAGVSPVTQVIVRQDGTALAVGDLPANAMLTVRSDGTGFRLLSAARSDILAYTKVLTAARTYYVNGATGSDASDGLTPGTALATIQAAVNKVAGFNLNGFSVTINVADGTYAPVVLPATSGSGSVNLAGNTISPANVSVVATAGPAIAGSGVYSFNGFKVTSNADMAGVPGSGDGFQASGSGTQWTIQNIAFGPCATAHIASDQARFIVAGAIRIGGSAKAHMLASNGGSIVAAANALPTLIISAACSFTTGFATVNNSGVIQVTYASITGAASVTGSIRYSATTNGVIQTTGSGINYYPGDTAGVSNTGGQYA